MGEGAWCASRVSRSATRRRCATCTATRWPRCSTPDRSPATRAPCSRSWRTASRSPPGRRPGSRAVEKCSLDRAGLPCPGPWTRARARSSRTSTPSSRYLRAERGLSPRTIEAYASDLVGYLEWLRPTGVRLPTAVRQEHVRGHLATLGRRLSVAQPGPAPGGDPDVPSLPRRRAPRDGRPHRAGRDAAAVAPPPRLPHPGGGGGAARGAAGHHRPPGCATGRCWPCSTPPGSG